MKRIVVVLLITMTLAFVLCASASAGQEVAEVVADVVLVRPLSLAATVVGTALFIASLPFAIPSGSINETARALVAAPFNYTFTRPIGYFGYPSYYATIWVGGVPYYYDANGVYYAPTSEGYVVVNPPAGIVTQFQPRGSLQSSSNKIFVYPRQGQSEQQQTIDQDACRRFAVSQTDYDPTLPPSGNPDARKRADYQRVMATCLDERGYAVK